MSKSQEGTIWVNYLRSFITVLVVLHHANLSYTTFAHVNEDTYIYSTHAVVDSSRWIGLDILVNFNDVYFMALMFFISGLFLIKSVKRKGQQSFLADRFKRLFIPFLILGTALMLISYAPAYYLSTGNVGLREYVTDFFVNQGWPVGPPWFIWVLFVFNLAFAVSYKKASAFYQRVGKAINQLGATPARAIIGLVLFTAILYIPITYSLTTNSWVGIGPFDMQLNRLFLYLGYFLLGIVMGGADFNNTILASTSPLVISWRRWGILALLIFVVLTIIPAQLTTLVTEYQVDEAYTWTIYYFIYVISTCFTSLAMVTIFKSQVTRASRIWDSLSEHAYLIYLCHFPYVVWCQFFLLPVALPAVVKMLITFVVSLVLSWGTSIALRKISLIRKYV